MFTNVLVGVDGGPSGRDAIALARQLMAAEGKLTLVHVHSPDARTPRAIVPGTAGDVDHNCERLLIQERQEASVDAELLSVEAASPGRGLHQQAEASAADLIVVGSCSRGALGRAVLGDETRVALNGAPCAVAVASRGYAGHAAPIARVGLGYNASPESDAALGAARALGAQLGATVHALDVVSIPSAAYSGFMTPAVGDSIEAMLDDARSQLDGLDGVAGTAVYGLAGEELAAFGEQVDILVVGSRGYGPIRRLVMGSTCDYLERHARCSLLALPRTATATATVTATATATAGTGTGTGTGTGIGIGIGTKATAAKAGTNNAAAGATAAVTAGVS